MFFRRRKTIFSRLHDVFDEYLFSLFPPYKKKDAIPIFVTLCIFTLVPLTAYATFKLTPKIRPEISSDLKKPSEKEEKSFFFTNEILIKVTEDAKGKIREGHGINSDIRALKSLKQELGIDVSNIERVARAGKNSDVDAEIFRWYKATLDTSREKTAGKLDRNINRLSSSHPAVGKLQKVIDKFSADYDIEDLELNYQAVSSFVPNDPYYSSSGSWGQDYPDMWAMHIINTEAAWDISTGDSSVVIANIDTGTDRTHEDLAGNIWINTKEIAGNGIDDDGNGYIDDYYGWDWHNGDSDPMDDNGHGTHTAGIIAAVGNNRKGVVGAAYSSKIMSLKFLGSEGSGSISGGAAALVYAVDNGAKVTSNSWSCYCTSVVLADAASYGHKKGVVMIVSAGNGNMDALDYSPASLDQAITVGAIDQTENRAAFSNWGSKIDVVAGGVDILSARAFNSLICPADITVANHYCRLSGTSTAAPYAAGLSALLIRKDPVIINEQVRQIIRMTSRDLGAVGKDNDFGFGIIDGRGAMNFPLIKPVGPFISSPASRTVVSDVLSTIVGTVSGPSFQKYKVELGMGRNPQQWTKIFESSSSVVNGALSPLDRRTFANGLYTIRVTGYYDQGAVYEFSVYDVVLGEVVEPEPTTDIIIIPSPTDSISPTSVLDNEAPTAPSSLTWSSYDNFMESDGSKINLQWSGSVDNVGVAGYRIYRNDSKIAEVEHQHNALHSYIDSTVILGESYYYFVTAYDKANNESEKSNTVWVIPTDKNHAVLFGIVTNATTGAPVQATEITLRQSKGGKLGSTRTDDNGKYSFILKESCDCRLEVRVPQFENAVIESTFLTGMSYEINIPLELVSRGKKN